MSDRNAQAHFNAIEAPSVKRSTFPLLFHNVGTCNTGMIVPFLAYSDILPGDTFKCDTTAIIRMQTPLNPTMDGLIYDIYYFSVPHRIVWDHWKEFMGEIGDNAAWETTTEYTVPMINAPASTGITKGTVADYMGLPKGVTGISYQALPFRAYTSVYNCWFRNQNLIAPATLHTDDTTRNGDNSVAELGGACFKAGKIPDYFTTCLPAPERALPGMTQGMRVPIGTTAPVVTFGEDHYVNASAMHLKRSDGATMEGFHNLYMDWGTGDTIGYLEADNTTMSDPGAGSKAFVPSNLWADLRNATAATINALRLAFQVQKLQELWARGGVRYFEVLKNEFGTSPNMSVLQYPEYLGGTRDGIQLQEVLQNSNGSTSTDVLGYTGGMSKTLGQNNDFTKSFQEHCTLLGILVIRQDGHLYQQSLNKMWTREKKLDYYTPILAHLGEQPVYKKEICATGTSAVDNAVFGYQERWGEYKYGRETTSGEMSSSYATSLDVWHYGDWYASAPTLAQNWFEETTANVDRTLIVKSTVADQFKFDIVTNIKATRPMPVYCTPGLIDHF